MLYYLLTQGTNSSEYSFILKNGDIIESFDNSRVQILENFQEIDSKGNTISNDNSRIKIKKFRSNYLIEVLTFNADRMGRKVPVELLLVNYSESTNLQEELIKIKSILKTENILLDQTVWMSIPLQIRNCLKKYNQRITINYVIGVSVAILLLLSILLFYNLNSKDEKHLEQKNISFSNR